MPALTSDQISAMARNGSGNNEIEAFLARPMTPEEKNAALRGRAQWKMARAVKRERGRIGDREKHNKANQADRLIPFRDPPPEEVKRRAKLERNPEAWLRWYMHELFPLPFSQVHRQIIRAAMRGMQSGTSVTVAAPRGFGKTAILGGMALYGVMTGKCRFPVVIGWKQTAGACELDKWLEALASNDRLAAGYPCVCDCFRESTASKRLQGLLRAIDPAPIRAGCDVRKGRGVVLLPETREPVTGRVFPQAALAGASLNGSIKGLNVGLLDGESLRPDIIMVDDPQDIPTAESPALVAKIIRRIDYGLRSLSGPQRRLTVMAAVTCVEPDDVSAHLLDRPGTEAIRCGQVVSWPNGWTAADSPTRAAWDEWNQARLDGLEALDGGAKARQHYRKNRATLTAGMTVSWRHRYHVGDADRASDPDALFAAMWDFYDLGEPAFMAERQNTPIKRAASMYELTPEIILSRASGFPRLTAPAGGVLCVGVDINYVGFNWSLVHGDQLSRARKVVAHGIWPERGGMIPKGVTTDQACALIRRGMGQFTREVLDALIVQSGTTSRRVDAAGFDLSMGAWQDAGMAAIKEMQTRWVYGIKAFGAKGYRPQRTDLRSGKGWRLVDWPRLGRLVVINSDLWREMVQRGFLVEPTEPGAVALYSPDPTGSNGLLANEVAAEHVMGQTVLKDGGTFSIFGRTPGVLNDRADSLVYACALTGFMGIGEEASAVSTRKKYSQKDLTRG